MVLLLENYIRLVVIQDEINVASAVGRLFVMILYIKVCADSSLEKEILFYYNYVCVCELGSFVKLRMYRT